MLQTDISLFINTIIANDIDITVFLIVAINS